MVTPALPVIAAKYNVSLDMAASLIIGFLVFWIGATTFFTASGANIWGKRPFFVVSAVVLLATNIWGFFAGVRYPYLSFVMICLIDTVFPIACCYEGHTGYCISTSGNSRHLDSLRSVLRPPERFSSQYLGLHDSIWGASRVSIITIPMTSS
jgi:hypothetical protein